MNAGLALVTGAASGIGRATALRLARDGYQLVLLDRDRAGLETTAAATGSASVACHTLDLRDGAAIDRLVGDLVRDRPPTLLVNVAGVAVARTTADTSPEEWDLVVGVNLTAVYRMCRAVLPGMIAAGGGVIVNVASVGGMIGLANRAAYCASKAGVIGLTKAIAVDHAGQGIRATAMCPGTVDTEWIGMILADAADPPSVRAAMEARQLDGRMGTADEVAAGIAFLASPDGRFVNGSAFVMDGGVTAR